ncbi:MAG: hypothetical protein IJY71_07385 [Clostridia bacterium]|nr:hypothetical protein [Clostridia bacterium]
MFLFGKRKQQQLEEERRRQEEERQRQEQQAAAREQRKQRLLSAPIIQDFMQKAIDVGVASLANIERPSNKEWAERALVLTVNEYSCSFTGGFTGGTHYFVKLNFAQAQYPNLSLSDVRILIPAMAKIIINEIAKRWDTYPGRTDRECNLKICEVEKGTYTNEYKCATIYRAKNAAFHQGWNSW